MKKFSFLGNFLIWFNSIVALLLLLCLLVPFLPPSSFSTISFLSVLTSPILVLNFGFLIYWLFRRKKQLFISLTVLIIAFFSFPSFIVFSTEKDASEFTNTLKVLSYNVRLFNAYEAEGSVNVSEAISKLLETQQPDVVCIQEFYKTSALSFNAYPYQYIHYKTKKDKSGELKESILGHAILSKYPIINSGAFDFHNTFNNSVFADIVKDGDTIRLYNLHLNSLGIKSSVSSLQDGDNHKIRKRLAISFTEQQKQLEFILNHKETSPHPVIMSGDFNNTPYSYVYRQTKKAGMRDAFLEQGNGLGATLFFDFYPMRIDYIFASEKFEILNFETIAETFSDHNPISATLGWNE